MTNRRKLKRVERQVIAACRAAQKAGLRLIRGNFTRAASGRWPAGCCPIEAVAPGSGASPNFRKAARKLGITEDQVGAIVGGVDSNKAGAYTLPSMEYFEIGRRVRQTFQIRSR